MVIEWRVGGKGCGDGCVRGGGGCSWLGRLGGGNRFGF